jgi:hypothetical protein
MTCSETSSRVFDTGAVYLIHTHLELLLKLGMYHSSGSYWLRTPEAQVQAWARSCEICDGQSGTGSPFSSSTSVPPAHHSTNCSAGAVTVAQIVARVPSGLGLTPPQKTSAAEIDCSEPRFDLCALATGSTKMSLLAVECYRNFH